MFLCLSDPQLPHLSNGDNNGCFYAIEESINAYKSLSTVPTCLEFMGLPLPQVIPA